MNNTFDLKEIEAAINDKHRITDKLKLLAYNKNKYIDEPLKGIDSMDRHYIYIIL